VLTRWLVGLRRDLIAFAATAGAILCLTAAAFTALFPRVMVSTHPAFSLTIWNAASAHNTLLVMTVVAAIFTPFVLAYQGLELLGVPPAPDPTSPNPAVRAGGPSSPVPEQPTPARPAPRPVGGGDS
jgi:Cytochrome bd terminal oxidase subunit II